jgi:hypothetical protein
VPVLAALVLGGRPNVTPDHYRPSVIGHDAADLVDVPRIPVLTPDRELPAASNETHNAAVPLTVIG